MFTGRRNKTRRPAEEIAAEKAAKAAHSMTCQCCGRGIFAQTGTIAHHGYMRPGFGQQTASCPGAKRLPFEANRDALGNLITWLRDDRVRVIKARAEIAAETRPVGWSYQPRSGDAWGKRPAPVVLHFTRENAAELWATVPTRHYRQSFDDMKAGELLRLDREVSDLSAEIEAQQARFDSWKHTHDFADGEWRAR